MNSKNHQILKFSLALIVFSIVVPVFAAFAQEVGQKAPDIMIERWINKTPSGTNPFSGRTVVLEFWATWCNPCRKAIPHINKLVDKFQDDRFIFVSVSKESSDDLKKFTKTTKMKAFVAADDEGKTIKNYGINEIPQCFIINADGIIVWKGEPKDLTEDMLRNYKQSGEIQAAVKETKPVDAQKPIYILNIYDANPKDDGFYSVGEGEIMFQNLPISTIFEILLKTNNSRFTFENNCPKHNFTIYYKSNISNQMKDYQFSLFDDICHALKIRVESKIENKECYIMTIKDKSKLEQMAQKYDNPKQQVTSDVKIINGKWVAKAAQFELLANFVESNFKILLENQTNMNGFYDFEVDKDSFDAAINDLGKLGIEIKKGNMPINIYHFECK